MSTKKIQIVGTINNHVSVKGAVKYNEAQELADLDKQTARENIGAYGYNWHEISSYYYANQKENEPGTGIIDWDKVYECKTEEGSNRLQQLQACIDTLTTYRASITAQKRLNAVSTIKEHMQALFDIGCLTKLSNGAICLYLVYTTNCSNPLNTVGYIVSYNPDTQLCSATRQVGDKSYAVLLRNEDYLMDCWKPDFDTTLTYSDTAADAKTVGDKITAIEDSINKLPTKEYIDNAAEGFVSFAEPQDLTDEQRKQARDNIKEKYEIVKVKYSIFTRYVTDYTLKHNSLGTHMDLELANTIPAISYSQASSLAYLAQHLSLLKTATHNPETVANLTKIFVEEYENMKSNGVFNGDVIYIGLCTSEGDLEDVYYISSRGGTDYTHLICAYQLDFFNGYIYWDNNTQTVYKNTMARKFIDSTLTQSNSYADAKAVGDRLSVLEGQTKLSDFENDLFYRKEKLIGEFTNNDYAINEYGDVYYEFTPKLEEIEDRDLNIRLRYGDGDKEVEEVYYLPTTKRFYISGFDGFENSFENLYLSHGVIYNYETYEYEAADKTFVQIHNFIVEQYEWFTVQIFYYENKKIPKECCEPQETVVNIVYSETLECLVADKTIPELLEVYERDGLIRCNWEGEHTYTCDIFSDEAYFVFPATVTNHDVKQIMLRYKDNGKIEIENTDLNRFEGATEKSSGHAGLVPFPGRGDHDKFLCGDGTWSDVPLAKVSGATPGQTVKISAVDENGVPTAWEAVAFPSGGGEKGWIQTEEIELTEPVAEVRVTLPLDRTETYLLIRPTFTSKPFVDADGNAVDGIVDVGLDTNRGISAFPLIYNVSMNQWTGAWGWLKSTPCETPAGTPTGIPESPWIGFCGQRGSSNVTDVKSTGPNDTLKLTDADIIFVPRNGLMFNTGLVFEVWYK